MAKREAFHQQIQDEFLKKYKVESVKTHVIKPRQNLWSLCNYKYKVPYWLVQRYNQDKDLVKVKAGDKIQIPIISREL